MGRYFLSDYNKGYFVKDWDSRTARPTVKICDQSRHWDVLSVAVGKGIGEITQCGAQGAHQQPAKKRSVFP